MKVVVFLIALVVFLASFVLFGYAFSAPVQIAPWMFFGGILTICISLAIPFHLLRKTD
ncbi:hypothetical protein GCM10009840_27970 [Pseudolysinimonas kribbensis]|uniref:DUF3098 domain-containing protein n=1 Tax=Pseudolysinimonas kribbensis TaxID=433641 RepID=A0ABQ6KAL9_9MICO|nr:hypothetical protein [Pseudolysinimonas kribbensis]GMA96384.1 hypothetical protein GCM10025881_32080 [Pseudolysinimonas kribbensis]